MANKEDNSFLRLIDEVENGYVREDLEDRFNYLYEMIAKENITCVFFLDKSARPASWLFKDFWLKFHPNTAIPDIRYINYGREKKGIVTEEDVVTVRELYNIPKNGNIVVLDEYTWLGTSLESATQLISQAFPNKKVFTIDLEQEHLVTLPSAYKGVRDRQIRSNSTDAKDRLLVEKHPEQTQSKALRELLRGVFGRTKKK